ncbi:MAG: gliding motility-associated ABC transporter permease subunit GldF [Bacteroidetes bacterium]|nr:MAG: gliding motility-associated ABC transporter permease subunit GldF [Bacteroidota bacterium]
MLTIYIKEIRSFLSSLIAYIVIITFLLAIGLFMWIYPDMNIIDIGYANLDPLFFVGPWVFIFLISAITMRSFSEEKKAGTIETLTTSPVSDLGIILGKFFAGVTLVLFALLPTLVYYYSIYELAVPVGNIDSGAIIGSYLGLLFVAASFVAIGMFASAITDNQIVSFIVSAFLCFVMYTSFEYLSQISMFGDVAYVVSWLGMFSHYESISRGVLDTRDAAYFLSLIVLFILLTKTVFGSRKW